MVRARRRGDRLHLSRLRGQQRQQALELAGRYIAVARTSVGQTQAELDQACDAVVLEGTNRRLAAGLLKLVKDRCVLEPEQGVDPPALRRAVFTRASAARQAAAAAQVFDREALMREAADQLGLPAAQLERQLYADLRSAHRLCSFDAISAEGLLEAYDLAQAQAVLLRAVRVTAQVQCTAPGTFRRLFHKLKFHRLLFTIEQLQPDSYRLVIDGPFGLFQASTKYGLQLALLLPALRECDGWSLQADVLWGKQRAPLTLELAGKRGQGQAAAGASPLPDEVATLLRRFEARAGAWSARPCAEVLNLPGVGLCVPDLQFEHQPSGRRVYLEVLGYWSRDAVWKRVELVERGLPQRILFAVSTRLRVSEAVLADDLPGALYVFKGALHAGAVETKLEQLIKR